MRKFFRWAAGGGIVRSDVAKDVESLRIRRGVFKKMHLSNGEGALLLKEASTVKRLSGNSQKQAQALMEMEGVIALRNYAMVNLMLRTGLRTIEVVRADIDDLVMRSGKRILRVQGKGHSEKDDFVVLTSASYKPLREYLKTRKGAAPGEPLFAGEGFDSKGRRLTTRRVQEICKDALRAIGLDGHQYSAHSLRHTTGTQILLNGGTMFDVQRVLRHVNPATSQIYVNTILEDQRLEKASEAILDGSFMEEKKKD